MNRCFKTYFYKHMGIFSS